MSFKEIKTLEVNKLSTIKSIEISSNMEMAMIIYFRSQNKPELDNNFRNIKIPSKLIPHFQMIVQGI